MLVERGDVRLGGFAELDAGVGEQPPPEHVRRAGCDAPVERAEHQLAFAVDGLDQRRAGRFNEMLMQHDSGALGVFRGVVEQRPIGAAGAQQHAATVHGRPG